MQIKDIKIDDLFAYLPEGKFAGYAVTRIEEDRIENHTDHIIYLRNLNNNRLRVVPFPDLKEKDWERMEEMRAYKAVEIVEGFIDAAGKVHANSRRLLTDGVVQDGVLIETAYKNTRKKDKKPISSGLRNVIVNVKAPGSMGAAMQKAVEQSTPEQPVEEPKKKVVQQIDYSSLARCYYADLDIIGKVYLTLDPDFTMAKRKFMHKLSSTMHDQCLEDFRNGTKNLYELKQTQISVNKSK